MKRRERPGPLPLDGLQLDGLRLDKLRLDRLRLDGSSDPERTDDA
jgi:hypothetical protein